MLRKILLSVALCGASLLGVTAQAWTGPNQEYEEVGKQGDQIDVVPEGNMPDGAVVQESEATRKAIQAEKARNAAENDKFGGAITIIAMCIVISALVILSILFFCFGKISTAFAKSRKRKAHGVDAENAESHHEEEDSGEAIAAIGLALAEHFGQGHDMEDTILTIRRMRKAYSPWNSKIYNLRQTGVAEGHHQRSLKTNK